MRSRRLGLAYPFDQVEEVRALPDNTIALFSKEGLLLARIPLEVAYEILKHSPSGDEDDHSVEMDYGISNESGGGFSADVGLSLQGDGQGSTYPKSGASFPLSRKSNANARGSSSP